MPDLDPYDLVMTSAQVEHGSHRDDAHDSLGMLRFFKMLVPIRAIIKAVSPNNRTDEFVCDLFEGGSDPAVWDSDHATRQDILTYNINPNKTYAVGDHVTVLLMPGTTALISPFAVEVNDEDAPQFVGQIRTGLNNVWVNLLDVVVPANP